MDDQWGHASNGPLESEYLDGISAALTEGASTTPKPARHP